MSENMIYNKWGQPIAPKIDELNDPAEKVGSYEWACKIERERAIAEERARMLDEMCREAAAAGAASIIFDD